jgi:hypothetical protein
VGATKSNSNFTIRSTGRKAANLLLLLAKIFSTFFVSQEKTTLPRFKMARLRRTELRPPLK